MHQEQTEERSSHYARWREELRSLRPEVLVPEYWNALHQNAVNWARSATVGQYWNAAKKKLPVWSSAYRRERGGSLLPQTGLRKFCAKGAKRSEEKAFTKRSEQTVQNGPLALGVWPKQGAPVPALNDLVRTRVTCLFLDGVEYFADRLVELAKELGIRSERNRKADDEGGYYAQHFYFDHEDYYRIAGKHEPAVITCEVQVATVLSTRVWDEAHKVYEMRRTSLEERELAQWDPRDPRFIARQLGHMVHLADGILMQLRDADAKKDSR